MVQLQAATQRYGYCRQFVWNHKWTVELCYCWWPWITWGVI